jgi:hypothetical protein
VAPQGSGWCEEFSTKYRRLCKEITLELAEACPSLDKAFDCSKTGKVLGIYFDTRNLSWRLPGDKVVTTQNAIAEAV